MTHFNVEPLSKSVIDPSIAHHLASHNIEMDETYEQDFEEEDWETVYGPLLDRGFEHDERLYAAFIDEDRGYGLFANIDILPGTLLGEYTGIITNASAGPTDYKWEYNSKPLIEVPAPLSESSSSNSSPSSSSSSFGTVYDLVELDLSLDARLAGNLLRFANHEDYPNADVVFIPYKNMWRIVYMSTHYIAKDEEISVHYGDEFWADEYEDEKIVTREWDQSYEDQEEEDPYYDLEDVEKEDEYEAEGDLEEEEEDVVIQHVFEFVDNEEELQSGEKQQEQVQQLDLNNKFLPFLASGKQQQQHQQLQRPLNFFNK